MSGKPLSGQTGSKLEVKLPSQLSSVGWGNASGVVVGSKVGIEVFCQNVSDGAKVSVAIFDQNGSQVEEISGRIVSNVFRKQYTIPSHKTESLFFTANLSQYNLQQTSPRLRIFPSFGIVNFAVLDDEGKTLESLSDESPIKLSCELAGAPNNQDVCWSVEWSLPGRGTRVIQLASSLVTGGKSELEWTPVFPENELSVPHGQSLKRHGVNYVQPKLTFQASCLGTRGHSNPIPYTSWVELDFGEQKGTVDLKYADDRLESHQIPANGLLRVKGPGAGSVEITNIQLDPPSGVQDESADLGPQTESPWQGIYFARGREKRPLTRLLQKTKEPPVPDNLVVDPATEAEWEAIRDTIDTILERQENALAQFQGKPTLQLSKGKYGYVYNGSFKYKPSFLLKAKDSNDPHAAVYEAIWQELCADSSTSEGGISAINAWDGEILTIGSGFSYKGSGKDLLSALKDIRGKVGGVDMSFNEALKERGLWIEGTGKSCVLYVVNTQTGRAEQDMDAANLIACRAELLACLMELLENPAFAQSVADAHWDKIKAHGAFPSPSIMSQWAIPDIRLAVHLVWGGYVKGISSFTSGNTLQILKEYGKMAHTFGGKETAGLPPGVYLMPFKVRGNALSKWAGGRAVQAMQAYQKVPLSYSMDQLKTMKEELVFLATTDGYWVVDRLPAIAPSGKYDLGEDYSTKELAEEFQSLPMTEMLKVMAKQERKYLQALRDDWQNDSAKFQDTPCRVFLGIQAYLMKSPKLKKADAESWMKDKPFSDLSYDDQAAIRKYLIVSTTDPALAHLKSDQPEYGNYIYAVQGRAMNHLLSSLAALPTHHFLGVYRNPAAHAYGPRFWAIANGVMKRLYGGVRDNEMHRLILSLVDKNGKPLEAQQTALRKYTGVF